MAAEIEVIDLIESDNEHNEKSEKEFIEIIDLDQINGIPNSHDNKLVYPSYYQRAFISILSSVIEVYHVILTPEELDILKSLINDLTVSAQRLFIRLYLRKSGWQRLNKLVYEDIPNVNEASHKLKNKNLCLMESADLVDYLELLTLPELKSVASSKLFLKLSNSSIQRDELMKLILESKSSGQQRIFFASTLKSTSNRNSKLDIIKQSTGPIIKINDQLRLLIDTAVSLYFLVSSSNQETNLSTAILVEINRRSYPKYKIIRTCPIFKTRLEYLEYQRALELEILLKEYFEEGKSIYVYIVDGKRNLLNCLQTCDLERSYFLRRFTAGWVYCRILSYLASNLESVKRYNEAVEIYQILLNQNLFCLGRRGKWWERLVLDTSMHLKDHEKALELCETAINDPWLRTSALTSIKRRLKRLKKSSESIAESELEEEQPEILTLKGKIQGGNVTGKKVKLHLDGDDLSLGTVEEFVLNEFSLDGWEGIHSESSYFTTIFALIFWDLLFELEVADVFQTAYQTAPLDLTTDAFYPFRKEALEERLKMIEEDFEDALKLLRKHHVTYHQVSCVGVNWADYAGEAGIELLVRVARGIGGMALSLILRQFCENYRHNRSGMPDLILWRNEPVGRSALIEHANGVIFAEVKSPRDRVSDAQRHWFSVLKSAGLRVIVVKVLDEEEPTSKKLKKYVNK